MDLVVAEGRVVIAGPKATSRDSSRVLMVGLLHLCSLYGKVTLVPLRLPNITFILFPAYQNCHMGTLHILTLIA